MKTFLTILTYLGMLLIILGNIGGMQITIESIADYTDLGPTLPHDYLELGLAFIILAAAGALLTITGGLFLKARSLWIPLIVAGSLCLISSSGIFLVAFTYYFNSSVDVKFFGLSMQPREYVFGFASCSLIPGLACLLGGLRIKKFKTSNEPVISLYSVLTYLGIAMMVLGAYVTINQYAHYINLIYDPNFLTIRRQWGLDFPWTPVGLFIGSGAVITLIGSLVKKYYFLWIPLIVIGTISVLSFAPQYYIWYHPPVYFSSSGQELQPICSPSITDAIFQIRFMIPGIALIAGGIILRRMRKKQQLSISKESLVS